MGSTPLIVRCACGWQTTGTEDEVVAETQEHGRRLHNMLPSRADVLAMVVEAEEVQADPPAQPLNAEGSSLD
jgi:predicted small metal-binding protein